MPNRVMSYLAARLNPAARGFDTRLAIAFAASGREAGPQDAFRAAWNDLPENQRQEICEAWEELRRSEAVLPPAPGGTRDR